MLRNTFTHISGVSSLAEQNIWRSNIYNWDEFKDNHHQTNLTNSKISLINSHIQESITAYNNQDYKYFLNKINSRDHWRAYPDMKNKCCFLDIETTGLSKHRDEVTLIGIYNGKESKVFINGKNLHEFENEIKKYDMIVTFNGKCFDVPFLKAKYPNVDFEKFHVDLRYVMRDIGYSGGLKRIEKDIGICRDDDLQEVDGFEAVRLWYRYKKGNQEALDLLVKYNIADIENLKVMMEFAFEKLKNKYFHSVINN